MTNQVLELFAAKRDGIECRSLGRQRPQVTVSRIKAVLEERDGFLRATPQHLGVFRRVKVTVFTAARESVQLHDH